MRLKALPERPGTRSKYPRNLSTNRAVGFPLPPTREGEPPVERLRTAFTAAARLDTKSIRHALNDVAKPHLLVADEAREAHPIWLAVASALPVPLRPSPSHGIRPAHGL